MPSTEKLSITIPSHYAKLVRDKVKTGTYSSNSEVIREALRVWETQNDVKQTRLDVLKRAIGESLNDPRPSIPAEKVFENLESGLT
ncbi:MAG: type II toxin-antitoxin system ParD family antitoxin [Verrucomicrobia bacterium]|nr:type II toxin-antitoxin system ParD family antitoxin [Verrucomicrobiota bacterium]MDA1065896.1 type II toxin-antitoxin system ParD family antitoxin [Verrucomicrobiota bacterium]